MKAADFEVHFAGLAAGEHHFDWTVGLEFFETSGVDGLADARIHAQLVLQKRHQHLNLQFIVNGIFKVPCDRCGELFEQPISSTNELLVEFSQKRDADNDEVLFVPHGESSINVAQYVYEFALLALPLRKTHPESECSFAAEPIAVQTTTTDPRWNALTNLK